MFIGVGVYKNRKIHPVYKYIREHNTLLNLNTNYLGFELSITIDHRENHISIIVNGKNYAMKFFNSIGHMVVILARYRGDKLSAIKELDISKSAFYEKCKKYNIQL